MSVLTTFFVRLRTILIFGVVLVCASLIWIGFAGLDKYKEVLNDKLGFSIEKVEEVDGEVLEESTTQIEPSVTIAANEENAKRDNFFNEYRIERDRRRSESVEILREIVNNPNSSASMRQEAQQNLISIADVLGKESKIENALVAKGFKDAVVVIQKEAVMVIVPSSGLRDDEIARISDIVIKVVGCKMEDVVIVPKTP